MIDAFRVETLRAERAGRRHGVVSSPPIAIGMLVSTAGALFLVSGFERLRPRQERAWTAGYLAMAACVLIGIVTTLVATEPEKSAAAAADHAAHAGDDPLTRVVKAAAGAFAEFLTRDMAVVVLVFVVLYKFCDAFAGAMTAPFVIDLGFTRNDYAAIVKGVGLAATLIGGFAGGMVARALPLVTCLWIGAFLQTASNLVFTWLALVGINHWALTAAIIAENFTGAIGTVIFVAYLSALCKNPLHTATQFALLTALAAVGRTYLSAGAGYVAQCDRLADVLRHQRAGRDAEPRAARLAAGARAFRHDLGKPRWWRRTIRTWLTIRVHHLIPVGTSIFTSHPYIPDDRSRVSVVFLRRCGHLLHQLADLDEPGAPARCALPGSRGYSDGNRTGRPSRARYSPSWVWCSHSRSPVRCSGSTNASS